MHYYTSTFPSKFSCCISWSLFPIPMKAQGCDSCSVQPSRSICSFFFFHPLPIRYTHGGGQKNLKMKNITKLHPIFKKKIKTSTQTVADPKLSQSTCHTSQVYVCMLFISLKDFLTHKSKKEKKQGKTALDALSLSMFPLEIGNKLHPYKIKIFFTLTKRKFS